jgi:hypothetical protein
MIPEDAELVRGVEIKADVMNGAIVSTESWQDKPEQNPAASMQTAVPKVTADLFYRIII